MSVRTRKRARRAPWLTIALVALAAVLAACGDDSDGSDATGAATDADEAKVGIFLPAEAPIFGDIVEGFEQAFIEGTGLPANSVTFEVKNAQGDNNLIQSIARQLDQGDYDLIGVLGTPALLALRQLNDERPLIAIAMTDPVGQGVAKSLGRPGLNVTGSTDAVPIEDIVDFVEGIEPKPTKLGTIYDPSNANIAAFTKDLKEGIERIGVELVEVPVSTAGEVSVAARSLADRTDGILLGPDVLAANSGLAAVAATAKSTGTPLYLAAGADPTTPGITAVLAPDNIELGRLAGEVAAKAFRGTPPGEIPFARIAPQLAVNDQSAKQVGVTLPASGD